MAEFMKCNTCLSCFPSMEVIKDHYRSDWHCFNSKRRSQGLPILRREQFLELIRANSKPVRKTSKITTIKEDHNVKNREISVPVPSSGSSIAPASNSTSKENPALTKAFSEAIENPHAVESNRDYKPKLGSAISIFDDKDCESAEQCIQYMSFKYGFFLPDMEYLVDLEGMLEYCNEKVKLGGICLFCQKSFPDGRACQHHMIAKSHCKIAYENGVDAEEFEDFYDFSATYEDIDDIELDENGEVVQDEATVNNVTGELVLPDGKVLGHRDFRVYYRQYYRPADTREPILAQQREELLRLGFKFGGMKRGLDLMKINSMNEFEVMDTLIKYQKAIRKGQIMEQRGKLRQEAMSQRREYKSTIDKLRSKETTTAKIRDYHHML